MCKSKLKSYMEAEKREALEREFQQWRRKYGLPTYIQSPTLGHVDLALDAEMLEGEWRKFLAWRKEELHRRSIAEVKHAPELLALRRVIVEVDNAIGRTCLFCGGATGASPCTLYRKEIADKQGNSAAWVAPYCGACAEKHQRRRVELQEKVVLLKKEAASRKTAILRLLGVKRDYQTEIEKLENVFNEERFLFNNTIDGSEFLKVMRRKGYLIK